MEGALNPHLKRFWFRLTQRLGCQHMLHFAGADAKGQGPQRPVRGGVAVAADDRHARLRDPQFGADHVHDPLIGIPQVKQPHTKLTAVVAERVDLLAGDNVGDRQPPVGGGDIVIGGGECRLRTADPATSQSEALKGLGAGHFMDQMAVDVDQRLFALRCAHQMGIPDFFQQRARGGGHGWGAQSLRVIRETKGLSGK